MPQAKCPDCGEPVKFEPSVRTVACFACKWTQDAPHDPVDDRRDDVADFVASR